MRFDPAQLSMLPVCVLSLVVHECAHGWMAERRGDPTPRVEGRLTLLPFSHLAPVGSIVLPSLLLAFHSPVLFGWAKPMPISWGNLEDPRNDPVRVALAGPIANALLAVLFAALARVAPATGFFAPLRAWCLGGVMWNCSVALLNLIPVPPLDGSWLLMRFLRLRHIIALHHFRGLVYLLVGLAMASPFTSSAFFGPLRFVVHACLALFGVPRAGLAS